MAAAELVCVLLVISLILFSCCLCCYADHKRSPPGNLLPIAAVVAANTTITPVQPPAAAAATTTAADDHVTRDADMIMLAMPSAIDEETHNFVTDTNVTEIENQVIPDHVVNLVISNKDWWIDIGATRHVCFDLNSFVEYKEFKNDEEHDVLYMCNDSKVGSSKAMGQGKVVLKFTSGNEVSLNEVLYVPDIHKNLISGSMLLKNDGFTMIVESSNLVLHKGEMYVGIACFTGGWIII